MFVLSAAYAAGAAEKWRLLISKLPQATKSALVDFEGLRLY